MRTPCPVANVYIESPIYTGLVKAMVTNQAFEISDTQVLIGNGLKGCSQVIQIPLVVNEPVKTSEPDDPEVFPVCVVTRS